MGRKITTNEFILRATNVHGDRYDYSLVNYVNGRTKIEIICPEHGIFEQLLKNHIYNKQKCPICVGKGKSSDERFIMNAKKIHGKIYNYDLVEYKHNNKKVKIMCREHGIFEQKPTSHLNGRGCSKCKIKSKGELFIADWLDQKSFDGCKNTLPLRYDFYLPDNNMLIEYDGEPHFREVEYLGGKHGFELRKTNDKIKTEYALMNLIYCVSHILKEKIFQIY
jgi:hypothetical protein